MHNQEVNQKHPNHLQLQSLDEYERLQSACTSYTSQPQYNTANAGPNSSITHSYHHIDYPTGLVHNPVIRDILPLRHGTRPAILFHRLSKLTHDHEEYDTCKVPCQQTMTQEYQSEFNIIQKKNLKIKSVNFTKQSTLYYLHTQFPRTTARRNTA